MREASQGQLCKSYRDPHSTLADKVPANAFSKTVRVTRCQWHLSHWWDPDAWPERSQLERCNAVPRREKHFIERDRHEIADAHTRLGARICGALIPLVTGGPFHFVRRPHSHSHHCWGRPRNIQWESQLRTTCRHRSHCSNISPHTVSTTNKLTVSAGLHAGCSTDWRIRVKGKRHAVASPPLWSLSHHA